jgi:hypothetical protein
MICSSCEILTIHRLYTRAVEPVNSRDRTTWNRSPHLEFHSSYQSLQRAARNGCTNCLSFHERFLTLDGGFKPDKEVSGFGWISRFPSSDHCLSGLRGWDLEKAPNCQPSSSSGNRNLETWRESFNFELRTN